MEIIKKTIKKILPISVISIMRLFFPLKSNLLANFSFLTKKNLGISFRKKIFLIWKINVTTFKMVESHAVDPSGTDTPHTTEEILEYIYHILSIPKEMPGVIVEAGSFKGSSSSKLSLAVSIVGRELVIFDSFKGIPENKELHKFNISGGKAEFKEGYYCGTINEVKDNINKYGDIKVCRFVEGFFEDSMPTFKESICAAILDVDLASSTRTCIKYIYPLLSRGGVIFSQDGHLPLVIDVLDNDDFWVNEVGVKKPYIKGLGEKKLVKLIKD